MILSRRKIHLFSSIGLAIILPIIFIVGILCRPTYKTVTSDTDQLLSDLTNHKIIAHPSNATTKDPITAFLQQ